MPFICMILIIAFAMRVYLPYIIIVYQFWVLKRHKNTYNKKVSLANIFFPEDFLPCIDLSVWLMRSRLVAHPFFRFLPGFHSDEIILKKLRPTTTRDSVHHHNIEFRHREKMIATMMIVHVIRPNKCGLVYADTAISSNLTTYSD